LETVYIAIGSNKGNRQDNVIRTLRYVGKNILIMRISSFIKTMPAEGSEGGFFLNGVIEGKTHLSPLKLFEFLQETERYIGRKCPHRRGDEREIDLDIIFYGRKIIRTVKLTVPHPRYRERDFVIKPLYEITPGFVDPVTGQTLDSIYRTLKK
jgi:2-amino-4-hydroxy-6-hydroxymethyldihydropteridine diphosphokinase